MGCGQCGWRLSWCRRVGNNCGNKYMCSHLSIRLLLVDWNLLGLWYWCRIDFHWYDWWHCEYCYHDMQQLLVCSARITWCILVFIFVTIDCDKCVMFSGHSLHDLCILRLCLHAVEWCWWVLCLQCVAFFHLNI